MKSPSSFKRPGTTTAKPGAAQAKADATQARIEELRKRFGGRTASRPVDLRHAGWALLVIVLLAGCFLYMEGPIALLEASPGAAIAPGKVVGKSISIGHRGPNDYHVDYSFYANGLPIQASTEVRRDVYGSLHAGDAVQVRYAPSDPQVSDLAGNLWHMFAFASVLPWFALFVVAFFDWARRRMSGEGPSTTSISAMPKPVALLLVLWLFGGLVTWFIYQVT